MKQFLMGIVLILSTLFAQAQAIDENNVLKVESLGWSGTNYVIKVTNKVSCSTTIRISYQNGTKDTTLSSSAVATIFLPNVVPTSSQIKVKRLSGATCISNPSSSWLEVCVLHSPLAIKFTSFSAQRVSADSVKITFSSEEDNTIEYYVAKISFDGKVWKEVAIVIPDGIVGNKTYTVTVKIKP